MFELQATKTVKGLFEFELWKKPPAYCAWAVRLGPIKGRILAISMFLTASALIYFEQPVSFLIEAGIMERDSEWLYFMRRIFSWGIFALGMLVYAFVCFFQQEKLFLGFDRNHNELNLEHLPLGSKNPPHQEIVPFRNIQKVEALRDDSRPQAKYGYLSMDLAAPDEYPFKKIEFALLSEEQFEIYPKNIQQIVDP